MEATGEATGRPLGGHWEATVTIVPGYVSFHEHGGGMTTNVYGHVLLSYLQNILHLLNMKHTSFSLFQRL